MNLLRELNSIIQLLLNYFYTKISSLDFIKKEENWYGKIWPSLCCSNEIDRTSTKEMLNISREVDNISKLEHPSVLKFIWYSPTEFDVKPKLVIITEFSSHSPIREALKLEK